MYVLVFDLDVLCCEIDGFEVVKICDMVVLVVLVGVLFMSCVMKEFGVGDVLIFSVCMEFDFGGM